MIKKLIFIIAFLSIGLSSYAQITTDNKWNGHYYLPIDFVFNGKFFVLKNIETVRIAPQLGTLLHIIGHDNTNNTRLTIDAYSNTVRGGALTFRRLRGDTLNPAPPLLDDVIGSINADGYGNTRFFNSSSGGLVIRARQNFSDTNRGTYVAIQSTRTGDTINREVARFDEKGVKYSNVAFPVGNTTTDSTFGRNAAGEQVILPPNTGGGTWGSITGTLSNQTDLQAALDAKMNSTDLSIYKTIAGFNADTIALASDVDIADLKGRFISKVNLSDTSTFATNADIADLYLKNTLKLNISDTVQLLAKRDTNALHYTKFANKADVSQLASYKTAASFNSDTVGLLAKRDTGTLFYTKLISKLDKSAYLTDTTTMLAKRDTGALFYTKLAAKLDKASYLLDTTGNYVKYYQAPTDTLTTQSINATGTIMAWNSIVLIGGTLLTANTTLTLPTVVGNTNKIIKFIRLDNTAFTVTIVGNGAEVVTLQSGGTELSSQNGSIAITAIDATNARQTENIGTAPVLYEAVAPVYLGSNFTIPAGSTTPATASDLLSITIPNAGVWEITPFIRANSSATTRAVEFGLYSNANVLEPNSEIIALLMSGASGQATVEKTYTVTTLGATTYKIRVWDNSASGLSQVLTDINGRSGVSAKKIGGFLPVSGTTVNYVYARRSSNQASFGAVDNVIWNQVVSGNIPLNTTTGEFTLTAGKTYELEASLNTTGTAGQETTIIWTDAANIPLTNIVGARVLGTTYTANESSQPIAKAIFTPTVNINVKVRVTLSASNAVLQSGNSYVIIKQIGSSGFSILPIANGGTGSPTQNFVDLTTSQIKDVGVTASTTPLLLTGNINDYLQYDIKNTSTGTAAQSGYSATANDGTPITKFVWMGKNNSTYNNPQLYNVGAANDGTILNDGGNLMIHNTGLTGRIGLTTGNATTPFFTERLSILNTNGNIGIRTITPFSTLDVNGSVGNGITSTAAAAYTVLTTDATVILSLAGQQAVTLPAAAPFTRRIITLNNPTGYLKSFAAAVTGSNGISTTKIMSNSSTTVQSDGTVWRIIDGSASDVQTKLFTAGVFLTGSLIVGGIEFSIVGANTTGATTFLQARLVGLPTTRSTTAIITRQSGIIFANETPSPSLTTTYQPLNSVTTAFNANYITNTYRLNDRTTGEMWDITLSDDGSINALLTVKYTSTN